MRCWNQYNDILESFYGHFEIILDTVSDHWQHFRLFYGKCSEHLLDRLRDGLGTFRIILELFQGHFAIISSLS